MRVRSGPRPARVLLTLSIVWLSLSTASLARDTARAAQEVQRATGTKDSIQIFKHLDNAIKADDRFGPAYYYRSIFEETHTHDSPAAIADMLKAQELWPNGRPDMNRLLVEDYLEDKQNDKAIAVLEKMAAANKKDPYPQSQLGNLYMDEGQPDKALPYLQQALEANPNDLLANLRLGDVFAVQKDWDKAVIQYQKVVDKAPRGGELATKGERGLHDAKQQILIHKVLIGAAWGVPAIIVLLVGVSLVGRRNRQPAGGGMSPTIMVPLPRGGGSTGPSVSSIPADGNDVTSPEGLLQNTLYQIARSTNLGEGVAYSVNTDFDALMPRAELNVGMDELNRINIDTDKVQSWVERNDGAPFFFAVEKREGSFVQAFGDLKDEMESREMRLGVPLVANGTFLGLIFLGLGKDVRDDLKVKVKKQIEKQMASVRKLAGETAASLNALIEHEQSYTDSITKFRTARYVDENLPAFVAKAQRAGQFCIAIMFEYDSYQQIHDSYGEGQSTTVLKLVTSDVRRVLNEDEDMIARLEGGRFVAFTQHIDETHATRIGNRIFEQIKNVKTPRTLPPPAASVGVAVYPTHAATAAELMSQARAALERSITEGRGVVTVLPLKAAGDAAPAPSPFPSRPSGTLGGGAPGRPPGIPANPSGRLGMPPPVPGSAGRMPPPAAPSGGGRLGIPAPTAGAVPGGAPPPFAPKGPTPPPGVPPAPTPAKPPFAGSPAASPFVPGRPGAGTPGGSSPFVPGRPAGSSPFVPGRPNAPATPGASPFGARTNGPANDTAPVSEETEPVPMPPAPRPPVPGARPGATPPASPFATVRPPMGSAPSPSMPPPPAPGPVGAPPPPYIPSRRAPGKGEVDAAPPSPPARPAAPVSAAPGAPPPVPPRPPGVGPPVPPAGGPPARPFVPGGRPAGASPFVPGRPAAMSDGPTPPPFVPSRRPEDAQPRKAGSATATTASAALAPSAAEREGYLPRAQFHSSLESALDEARSTREEVSLVYIALDHYEDMESQGGNTANNAVQAVAGMVKSLLNEAEDIAGAWSPNGLVILKPRTNSEGGINFAEWVRVTVSHLNFPEYSQPVSVSMGVAAFPQDAETAERLVECAEHACQDATSLGGNTSQQYGA